MIKLLLKILKWGVAFFFCSTILVVVMYRFIPVYITPLMVIRCFQQVGKGEHITWHHHWVPLDNISPHLPVAVMASEDQRFLIHHGFDLDAIEKAARHNRNHTSRKWEPAPSLNRQLRMCFYGQEGVGLVKALRCILPHLLN